MTLKLSARTSRITQAEIRAMSIECERLGGINLAQGVCDTEVPEPVRRGAQRAIDDGINSYTRYDGLLALREAIARKLYEFNRIQADPSTDIIVSAGSTGSFYCTCLALLDPGDKVILFEPYYGYHVNTLRAVEAIPRFVKTQLSDWEIDWDEFTAAITPRTKAIVLNTPANPSGKVFSERDVFQLADLACRHDLFVFTDEIYEHFVYNGPQHLSPSTLPGMKDRTISISGLSKTYSITGWRIGYSASRADWAKAIGHVNDLVYVCAPAPLQMGVAEGLNELDSSYYQALSSEYEQKRDRLCHSLSIAGLTPHIPAGAYYVLADVSKLPGQGSREKAMYLLRQAGVATVPGEAFYHDSDGENLVRLCFAKRDAELGEACRRLEHFSVPSHGHQSVVLEQAQS
jgi:aminotransferase